jgi:hypothetical protein
MYMCRRMFCVWCVEVEERERERNYVAVVNKKIHRAQIIVPIIT